MLSWERPDRGAEAKSSRAIFPAGCPSRLGVNPSRLRVNKYSSHAIPRNFGGLSERCSKIFRRSCRRQSRRGNWGAWLKPAHCHPCLQMRLGWSAIEERGGALLPARRFHPRAFPSFMD